MYEYRETTADHRAEAPSLGLEDATPAPCPSPMPIQTIEFWTPLLIAAALLQFVRRLAGTRPSAFSAANSNEPR